MKTETLLKFSIIFLLGFLSASFISFFLVYGLEIPSLKDFGFVFSNTSNETPFDFIKENQIEVYSDRIIIKVDDASLSRYAPTGSMKPLLDENSNGIRIIPKFENEIHVGDIITFKQDNQLIVHRIIEKGIDKEGVYFITKGDNNSVSDGKIRFKDVKYITIGVIW